MSSHQTWRRARVLLPKVDDSSMPLGRSRITARDLGWAEPWVIQDQTTLTELRSAKHYANDCNANRCLFSHGQHLKASYNGP